MTDIFTSFRVMREHFDILPPSQGQRVFIDSEGDDAGWYVYNGQEWVHQVDM